MTHLTCEINERDGKCGTCGESTVLISAGVEWGVDIESSGEDDPDAVYVDEELTAHFCLTCNRMTSLSFNASPM